MIQYALHIYNASGVKQAVVTDFQNLSYIRRVNKPGAVWFSLVGDHPISAAIGDKWMVNIRRQREDGSWDDEIWALHRDEQWTYFSDGSMFASYSQGIKSMLGWRVVNWSTAYDDRSLFDSEKGETIMKTLVNYNAAASATIANGRKREGAITGLTVQSDSAGGNTIDWRCHGDNLLKTLQELALPAGGDFDLVVTTPTAFNFRFYSGQLGTDLSATIVFSMNNHNMANPQYSVARSSEKTVAAVWGRGERSARNYATRTGTNYNVSTNNIEIYVDAKSIEAEDTDGLNSKGDLKLDELESKDKFVFKVIQNEGYRYRENYNLGDLVTTINPFTGTSETMQVKAVAISLSEGGHEEIEVELEIQ